MSKGFKQTLLQEDIQTVNKDMKKSQQHELLGKCKPKSQRKSTSHPLEGENENVGQ